MLQRIMCFFGRHRRLSLTGVDLPIFAHRCPACGRTVNPYPIGGR